MVAVVRNWFRDHRPHIGYLVLTVGVVGGFIIQASNQHADVTRSNHARLEARRQACQALREDRVLLGKVIDAAIPPQTAQQPAVDPALDPALRRLIEQSRARSVAIRSDIGRLLAQPIDLCRHTGVDPSVHLSALHLAPVRGTP